MELVRTALVGGLLALDGTSVGQVMVSRPLVAGALTGWLLGVPGLGIFVGALLELYLLVSAPYGGARFPEGATATVVAVAVAASSTAPGSLPLSIAVGLVWGQVGGLSISGMRVVNGRFAPPGADVRATVRIGRAHVSAMVLDFARATAVTATGVAGGRVVVAAAAEVWPLSMSDTVGLLLGGAAVSTGIYLRDLGGFRKRRYLFVAGLTLGLLGARML